MTPKPFVYTPPRTTTLLLAIASALIESPGQTPVASRPAFEVASIRPSAGPGRGPDRFSGFRIVPGSRSIEMRDVTLRMLVTYAYKVEDFQVVGWPNWVDSDHYDIQAKAEDNTAAPAAPRTAALPGPMALRVQSLLDDRFELRTHREVRELPIYELTQAKGGAKLASSAVQGPPQVAPPGVAPSSPPSERPQNRGSLMVQNSPTGWTMQATAVPITDLVNFLAGQVHRSVVDRTGLTSGLYDVKLQWVDDLGFQQDGLGGVNATAAPEHPPIFTAIQEQLGLRIVPGKSPVEVLVIDSVEKPSAN